MPPYSLTHSELFSFCLAISDILNIQVLLFVGIVMYFAANALQSTSPFLTVSLPFAAVLVICAFIAYSRLRKGDKAPPRDLFSLTVLWRCISAPFYPVSPFLMSAYLLRNTNNID